MRKLCLYLMCIFVFSLPWQNAIAIGGTRTLSAMLGLLVFWLTLTVVLAEWRLTRPSPLLVVMVLFAAWQILTLGWTISQDATIQRGQTLLQLLAMVWVIGELGESERQRRYLMQAYVIGCFVATAALVQSWMSGVPAEGYRYAPETFNLNETADTLAIGIVMALILLTHNKSRLQYWANIAYVPLAVLGVIITGSRSGFVGTCIALVGVYFVVRETRPMNRVAWWIGIVGAFSILFFTMPPDISLEQNLRRVTFLEDTGNVGTMTGRTVIWSAGYSVFKEHSAIGVGAGTFRQAVGPRLDRTRSPHNLFISVAVETGIAGLLLVCAVLLSALLPVIRARNEPRGLYLVLFAVLMATAFVANVDTSKVIWFGLAMLSLTGREGRARAPATAYDGLQPSAFLYRHGTNPAVR
jgi:O-antigen ligase